ncbi:MAG: sodium:proton antiporter [Ignavibacteriae bacterium]|nr:sodium:proton antiporter [Ignavibacteriota bacterium]
MIPVVTARASETHAVSQPHPAMIAPFILLLLAIALMPFIHKHWWEKYYAHVSVALALVTIVYYVGVLSNPVRMLHSGIEFFSFICLVGSLFVVAGGMHIGLKGYSTPVSNTILLLFGAVLSNLVGTTGASMVLIRPYIRNNRYRIHPYHVVFFIFIVSNMGGSLTPIGDPPLFLGYLRGIPFFWVLTNLWPIWLLSIALILAVFVVIDTRYYRKVPASVRASLHAGEEHAKFEGWHNMGFLLVILLAVFIQEPPYLREALMLAAAAGSYLTTNRNIHKANDFNFAPIKEVGFLFIGLFATMVPALDWLEANAVSLGITSPGHFYWGSGALSSFLDNAPTYLNFLSAAFGLFVTPATIDAVQALVNSGAPTVAAHAHDVQQTYAMLVSHHADMVAAKSVPVADIQVSYLMAMHPIYIQAISIGAVFFGANTYIGNAPNFMVKSISEQLGVRMPSFFGYMVRYSIPVLIPIFTLVWLLFFSAH